ncbi:NAD-dependent epimerase [Burkholderiales bacterium]|nr:NAD-dependent epimerase [Burkholderiales bacterium]
MEVLVTGSAGFIGSALVHRLLQQGHIVWGMDNHNDYYDPSLKEARIRRFIDNPRYTHLRVDLSDINALSDCFEARKPNHIVHLAAQAGVRYSLENPRAYIDSNILGFSNILEVARTHKVEHLVYASSSSVYGSNGLMPFSVHHNVDHPLSLYAASKKSNELMAHSYSHLYQIPTTGLRFFTVYGPWGRPDMALFKFTKAILANENIQVFNNGNHIRDFTYIEDIVDALICVIGAKPSPNLNWSSKNPDPGSSSAPWRIYNIGSNNPIKLMDCLSLLEAALGRKSSLEYLPLQPGDVQDTHADVRDLVEDFGYAPKTSIESGISNFVNWYRNYYSV